MISKDQINEISEIIIKEYNPQKIVLFGSYAKGTAGKNSDLDLLIIADKEKEKPRWKRGLKLRLLLSKYTIPRDLLFYSSEEIAKWLNTPMSFVHTVLKEGKILYEQK
ncbi:MAG: nucleotidyltransferase domain-containing protein [Leptospiraceae bacterium]|nr:nucleotidyltransferase domain-containing protein [Leptospiraceae bacterium]